jgi:exopolysaccharide production protein ExoY
LPYGLDLTKVQRQLQNRMKFIEIPSVNALNFSTNWLSERSQSLIRGFGMFTMGLMPFDLEIQRPRAGARAGAGASALDARLFGLNGPLKRIMDILIAVPAIFFLLPVFILTALAIKLEDGGRVFFIQRRIGRGGHAFPMIKFRSMRHNADAVLEELLADCAHSRNEWLEFQKLRNDPRITRVGRFLRGSSIDELPQLLNVVAGQMSIVGQRPILFSQRDAYGVHIAGYERARPGITGLWQIRGRNRLNFEQRAELDSEYINSWSLWNDVKIVAMTVPAVLLSRDAF